MGRIKFKDENQLRQLQEVADKVAEWKEKRDALIVQAVNSGHSYRTVGEVVGLSHTAVGYIASGMGPPQKVAS
jgi:hypothetical protein